jgi:hypothetical protein
MRGTLVFHSGVGSGYPFGTLHSQRSPEISESTVIGRFLLEVPSHSCSVPIPSCVLFTERQHNRQ